MEIINFKGEELDACNGTVPTGYGPLGRAYVKRETAKAVLMQYENGQIANPFTEKWIPKSVLRVADFSRKCEETGRLVENKNYFVKEWFYCREIR